jgi:hypothetical protein
MCTPRASVTASRTQVTVDGQTHTGHIAALTIANAAPPASLLAHGHVGDTVPDGEGAGLAGTPAG